MDLKMKELNQKILEFEYKKNFNSDDFYVSENNKQVFDFLNKCNLMMTEMNRLVT